LRQTGASSSRSRCLARREAIVAMLVKAGSYASRKGRVRSGWGRPVASGTTATMGDPAVASWQWKAPQALCTVRVRSCGSIEAGASANAFASGVLPWSRPIGDNEELEGFWVRLCAAACMQTRMNSAGAVGTSGTTRSVGSASVARNASEEQSFVRCARVSQWLQKSTSGVRSREVAPVAAGEADGDLA